MRIAISLLTTLVFAAPAAADSLVVLPATSRAPSVVSIDALDAANPTVVGVSGETLGPSMIALGEPAPAGMSQVAAGERVAAMPMLIRGGESGPASAAAPAQTAPATEASAEGEPTEGATAQSMPQKTVRSAADVNGGSSSMPSQPQRQATAGSSQPVAPATVSSAPLRLQ